MWTRSQQNTINYPAWLITHAVLDVVQDLATLCLPLFVIRKMNMSRKRKIIISGIFWLGALYENHLLAAPATISNCFSSCVIASIVRLVYFVDLSRMTERDRQFSSKLTIIAISYPDFYLRHPCQLAIVLSLYVSARFLSLEYRLPPLNLLCKC